MTSPEKTISISVPTAQHVAIGCLLALVALCAFFVYTQLPAEQAHLRGSALALAIVGSVAAMSYWLWCASQCLRSDVRDNGTAIEDARAELRTAKAEIFAKLDSIIARLDDLGDEVGQNRGEIKELTDAVDGAAEAVREIAGDVVALQECYLTEGEIPAQRARKEAPRESS